VPALVDVDMESLPAQPKTVSLVEPATAAAYDDKPVFILGLGPGGNEFDRLSCITPSPRVGGGLFLDICANDTLASDAPDKGFGRKGL
jgi:hypothetical protein